MSINDLYYPKKHHVLSWTLLVCLAVILSAVLSENALSQTVNGNTFALYYSEARSDREREGLMAEAKGKRHFFRYLQIMEMEEITDEMGRTSVAITAFEPSSLLDVVFTVNMRRSLAILREEPESVPGHALAVTGRVVGADPETNAIKLDPVIVQHKDRLAPKIGKEMLFEVSPGGVFYSYTRGPRPINITYRDRDLLRHRDKILAEGGEKAWFEFLEREMAERRKARQRGEQVP